MNKEKSMADSHHHAILSCLVGIMDELWFHEVVLVSPTKTLHSSSTSSYSFSSSMAESASLQEESILSSNSCSSAQSSQTQVISEDNSSLVCSNHQDDEDEDDDYCSNQQHERNEEERPECLSVSCGGGDGGGLTRCQSLSPSKRRREKRRTAVVHADCARRRLSKTTSCKSFCELELEEVKGFMDLGFTFEKEHLNKRMMSVIPGLQRLDLAGGWGEEEEDAGEGEKQLDLERGGGGGGRGVIRPYLSEAWLIKRPDSPLLNLRIPRVSTAEDMKKHLKYWAKTVASAVQYESASC